MSGECVLSAQALEIARAYDAAAPERRAAVKALLRLAGDRRTAGIVRCLMRGPEGKGEAHAG